MKIAFLTRKSPYDKRSWSGAFFSIYEKLRINNYVEWVKPLNRGIGYKLILTFLAIWYKFTNGKRLNIVNEIYASSTISSITQELDKNEYDIIFAAASPELIAYLETRIPVLYFLDATFKQLAINYPSYSNLPKWNFKQGLNVEKAALHRADHIVVSSLWTKNSIIEDFYINPKKISIIGFGANMIKVPTKGEIYEIINKRINNTRHLKLLFVGKNWNRKGGEFALNAFESLNEMNILTSLTIIGTVPPVYPSKYMDMLTVIPNLDINKEKDFLLLYQNFEDANFFILPTRGDCTPIVFSEAAAFGLPVITTDVGGVKDVVMDDISGKVLSLNATGNDYAESISQLYLDKERYKKMALRSRERYEEYLNWDSWSKSTIEIMENLINRIEE